MSYANLTRNASAQAQRLLARLGGMAADAAGNVLYNGAHYTGVFGQPQATEAMNAGGGNRKRAEVALTLTRAQFDAPPRSQTQLTRTDVAPPITYRIADIDTHNPLSYVLTLVKVGE